MSTTSAVVTARADPARATWQRALPTVAVWVVLLSVPLWLPWLGGYTALAGRVLVLGLAARFALFRTFVFKRPISIVEIYDEPGVVDGTETLDGDAGSVNESAALARGRSTGGPVPPSALGPEGD